MVSASAATGTWSLYVNDYNAAAMAPVQRHRLGADWPVLNHHLLRISRSDGCGHRTAAPGLYETL